MTKTIHFLSILAIAVILIGSISIGTVAFADDDDDDDDDKKGKTPISFSWTPDDSSSDLNNLIIVSGSFSRLGLLSDTTTAVQGEFAGNLKAKIKNESTTSVVTTTGSTTISTTVEAHSQKASKLQGTITIDGEEFSVKFKPAGQVTILQVTESFTGPTVNRSLTQEKITISGTVKMCTDDKECLEGFGTVRRESSITFFEGDTITFVTDELEAEVIGDSGLFKLGLSKLQRTVELAP